MNRQIVVTLTGRDKVGLVDGVTNVFAKRGGNVDESRMARLGGEFAMLVLVAMPEKEVAGLEADLQPFRDEGYQVTLTLTEDDTRKFAGWLPYEIEVEGADQEGIIHEVAHHLAMQGINIENLDTYAAPAPMSGAKLFTMAGIVLVPPHLNFQAWSTDLEQVGDQLNVSVRIELAR